MMDFDGKDKVIKTISQNKTLYDIVMQQQQQILALGQIVDQTMPGNNVTARLMQQMGVAQGAPTSMPSAKQKNGSSQAEKAAAQASDVATPR